MSEDRAANRIRFNQHRNRKNNNLVAAMHALYDSGKSLAQVGEVYGRTRQAVYDVFRTRGYPLRSKRPTENLVIGGTKFTKSGKSGQQKGLWRRSSGNREFLHTFIWEINCGPVPAGHGIHHKDGDIQNNKIENLECLPIAVISSKYSPHLNQFTSPKGSRVWRRVKGFLEDRIIYAKKHD